MPHWLDALVSFIFSFFSSSKLHKIPGNVNEYYMYKAFIRRFLNCIYIELKNKVFSYFTGNDTGKLELVSCEKIIIS